MKRNGWLFLLSIPLVVACVIEAPGTPGPSAEGTENPQAATGRYGYMLTPVLPEDAERFAGSWKGNISGYDFTLRISTEDDVVASVLDINGASEQLFILGANETTLYMFRQVDNACLSMYFTDDGLVMEYYEQGAPRVIPLLPAD
jgi:hypothetical protein